MSRIFDAIGDHLDNSTPPWTAPPGTISCWAQFIDAVSPVHFVNIGTAGSATNAFRLNYINKKCGCTEDDGTTSIAQSTTANDDTAVWHLLTATLTDHTNRAAFFDGAQKGTVSVLKAATASNAVRISGNLAGTGASAHAYLAHIAVWDIVLSDAEVLSLYSKLPSAVQPTRLLEYWPLLYGDSPEHSIGTAPHDLTVTGTTFSNNNPNLPVAGYPGARLYNQPSTLFQM